MTDKRFILLLAISVSLMVPSCTEDIKDMSSDANTITPELQEPSLKRIQVSDALAEQLAAEPQNAAAILGSSAVKSVSPTFYIGGAWEAKQREFGLHQWFDVEFAQDAAVTKAATELSSVPGVIMVEDVQMITSKAMNDPKLKDQWQYLNLGDISTRRAGIDIKLQEAWEQYGVYGNESVIVAIIDGGVDYTHEDLATNMWVNQAELNGADGVDDDDNGYIDDIYGYNFVDKKGEILPNDHGTHVAGTVAAVNNNGKGVCGVAGGNYPQRGAQLMSLQVFDQSGSGAFTLTRIMQYATENGAVIAQCSYGYQSGKTISSSDRAAIDYFCANAGCDPKGNQIGPMKGGLPIYAAGNEERDYGPPAEYEKCVAVSAIGPTGKYAYYTNYGDWVDVAAPGGDQKVDYARGGIPSTLPKNHYGDMQGTSMACPHVSGLAALIVSEFGGPGFTNEDLRAALINSCDPSIYQYSPDMEGLLGVGMIQVTRAIAQFSTKAPDKIASFEAAAHSNFIDITTAKPTDPDDGFAYYINVYYKDKSSGKEECRQFSVDEPLNLSGLKFENTYTITLTAVDYAGNESARSASKDVTTGKNSAPEIVNTAEGEIRFQQWDNAAFIVKTSEPDGHAYNVDFQMDEQRAVEVVDIDGAQFKITIRGNVSTLGMHSITVTAKDEFGATATLVIPYEVFVNHPPKLTKAVDPVCINGVSSVVDIPIAEHFADEDNEDLTVVLKAGDDKIVKTAARNGNINLTGLALGLTAVTVTVSDGAGESASCKFDVLVRDNSTQFDTYPNPVKTDLNIRAGEKCSADVVIYNSLGAKVLEKNVSSEPFSPAKVDMSQFNAGAYTVLVNGEKHNIVKL